MCNFGLGAIDSPKDLRDYDYSMLNNIDEEVEQAIQSIIDSYEQGGN